MQPDQPLQDPPPERQNVPVPACQECGRQDETLRLVIYPFVVSLVFITFRRSFRGLWCSKHRAKHLAFAGLISSVLGWIGIPFGLVFTPVALYQLAKGGIQPTDPNIQMLSRLSDDKCEKGDIGGAVRCLEECLKFKDDQEVRRRLNEVRPRYGPQPEPVGCWTSSLNVLGALYKAILIGVIVGMVDYGAGYSLGGLLGNDVPLYLAIGTWLPLLLGAFISCLVAKGVLQQSLLRIRAKGEGLAVSLAVLAALLLTYGIFQGELIADNIHASATGLFESTGEAVAVWILTLVVGGFFGLWGAITSSQLIYLGLVALATVFFLLIIVPAARNTILWQKRIRIDLQSP